MGRASEAFSASWPAAGDLSTKQYYLVEQNDAGEVAVATVAGQRVIGVLQRDDAAAQGRAAAVQFGGIAKVKCGGTVDEDDWLISNASGQAIASADGGFVIGRALEAGASGDVITVILATSGGGGYNASKGWIQLPLADARELSSDDIINTAGAGGVLTKDTTPILEATNTSTDRKLRLNWAAGNADKVCWDVALPPDLDDTQAMTLHAYAKMGGATNTPTLTWTAFFNTGDADAGGATAALSATLAEVTRTLAAGDVPAPPGGLTVTLHPGTHANDAVLVNNCWIEYTRR